MHGWSPSPRRPCKAGLTTGEWRAKQRGQTQQPVRRAQAFRRTGKGSNETIVNWAQTISITSLRAWNFTCSLSFSAFLRRMSCCFSTGSLSLVTLASCSLSSARRFSEPFSRLFSMREICCSSPVWMLRFWTRATSLSRSSLSGRRAVFSFAESVEASEAAI
jgi:hypothetical protein